MNEIKLLLTHIQNFMKTVGEYDAQAFFDNFKGLVTEARHIESDAINIYSKGNTRVLIRPRTERMLVTLAICFVSSGSIPKSWALMSEEDLLSFVNISIICELLKVAHDSYDDDAFTVVKKYVGGNVNLLPGNYDVTLYNDLIKKEEDDGRKVSK